MKKLFLLAVCFLTPNFTHAAATSFGGKTTHLAQLPLALQTETPNEVCAEAKLQSLFFLNVNLVQTKKDLCLMPSEQIPAPARTFIKNFSGTTHKIAGVLGASPQQVWGKGISVIVQGSASGAVDSVAVNHVGIVLGVFADWKEHEYAERIYAHEITHFLSFEKNPLGRAMRTLNDHPFLIEALPDVVAALVSGNPVIASDEDELPECLSKRDGTPLKTLDAPFEQFLFTAAPNGVAACCASIKPEQRTARTNALCANSIPSETPQEVFDRFAQMSRKPITLDLAGVNTAFDPDKCRVAVGRAETLGFCEIHNYGPFLVSFFLSLQQALGRNPFPEFIQAMLASQTSLGTYECGFPKTAGDGHLKTLKLKIQALMPAFVQLRKRLNASEQGAFDRVWEIHRFEKLKRLDELYISTASYWGSADTLSKLNLDHDIDFHCTDIEEPLNEAQCKVTCRKI